MQKYRIASFNMHKFSTNSKKDYEAICRMIKENNVDILAIQEIFSKDAMNKLLTHLDGILHSSFSSISNIGNWDGRWASPDSKSVSAAEGYAFIWNTRRVQLSYNRSGRVYEPVIHNQYPHRDGIELIRNPFYGRFILTANKFIELRLINAHIMFSLNREENESDDHDSSLAKPGAVSMRKKELDILATKILPKIDDKVYDYPWMERDDYCRKPYTFLLGDYNLNLKGSEACDSFIDEERIKEIVNLTYPDKEIVTIQRDLSTLRAAASEENTCMYRNNFDHFTYDKNRPVETRAWAVDVLNDKTYVSADFEKYRKDISDHLMVIMEIEWK